MNCQKETAEIIVDQKAVYLLSVKDNHQKLKTEKGHGRIETRTAYVTHDVDRLTQKSEWKKLCCIGAINTKFETDKGVTNEWHYHISSKCAINLIKLFRSETQSKKTMSNIMFDCLLDFQTLLQIVDRN